MLATTRSWKNQEMQFLWPVSTVILSQTSGLQNYENKVFLSHQVFVFGFVILSLNSGLRTCLAGVLPLEPHLQPLSHQVCGDLLDQPQEINAAAIK
jgi:hypothetical protein